MSAILARVDCEDVPSEAIDKVEGSLHCNHFNDVKHSWIGLNSYFLGSPKNAITFLIVGDSISACRRVPLIANLGDHWGVDAIKVYTQRFF